jgi:hypothetical protein
VESARARGVCGERHGEPHDRSGRSPWATTGCTTR